MLNAVAPIEVSFRTADLDLDVLRAAITTDAPAFASSVAMPNPIPQFPPVTIATLPLRSNMLVFFIFSTIYPPLHNGDVLLIRDVLRSSQVYAPGTIWSPNKRSCRGVAFASKVSSQANLFR